MILEISSALIFMLPSAFCLLLAALDERLLHLLELPRDAAVVNDRPDARHDAAENRAVDFGVDEDLAAGGPAERLADGFRAIGVDRHGGRDFRTDDLAVIHHALAIGARERRQQLQAIAVG